jgi:putative spermidine/putrescine transport system substrate-binding protein
MEFIKFSTDTQRLADQAAWISYGPARQSSIPLIGSHAEAGIPMRSLIPTAPENFRTALQSDFEFWADYHDELKERFDAWLAE